MEMGIDLCSGDQCLWLMELSLQLFSLAVEPVAGEEMDDGEETDDGEA